jgi:hypothetical protein
MYSGYAYDIRTEHDADSAVLVDLAALDSAARLKTPALVAYDDGAPVAAVSLVDERTVADPFRHTESIRSVLRVRAGAIHAHERTPSLIQRIVAQLRRRGVAPAS